MSNVDPVTGERQDIVTDQDLKNGLSSDLEFAAEAFRIAGEKGTNAARDYLLQVARDITSGKGHPAPNPGPVTPRSVLGASAPQLRTEEAGMEDRVKTIVSTAVTAGVVLVPGVGEAIEAVGGQAEVTATVVAGWGLIHGLVHYVHGKIKH